MNDFETVRDFLKEEDPEYTDVAFAALGRIEAALQDAETDLQMHEAEVERLTRVCAEWQDEVEAVKDDLHKRQEVWEAEVERLRAQVPKLGEDYP